MENLWKIANSFRYRVCSELDQLQNQERLALRGDYLFIIDNKPYFVVVVDEFKSKSIELNNKEVDNYPLESARTTITTTSHTLEKLLCGKLKAKIAFLTGKVELAGDLPAFLRMVSLLKKHGVKPINSENF